MPSRISLYRCLLISPSDVAAERDALRAAVDGWNAHVGSERSVRVDLVSWEVCSTPDLADPAQEVINRQLVDGCELAVAVFWTRLGTPTRNAPSGSIEEIRRIADRGGRVIVYFCSRDVPQHALIEGQYSLLQETKRRLREEGLCGAFASSDELQRMFTLHLTSAIDELQRATPVEAVASPSRGASETAERFNIGVRVGAVQIVPDRGGAPEDVIQIRVENRSPRDAFLGNVFFKCEDGRHLLPMTDYATGEHQRRRTLHPREAFYLIVGPSDIAKRCPLRNLVNVGVYDDLSEEYMGSAAELRETLVRLGVVLGVG